MKIGRPIVFRNTDFSRASEATYYGYDRLLKVAMVDQLRYGFDPYVGDPIGAIAEPAATNALTKSVDFSHSAWIKSEGVSIEASTERTPDGSLDAEYILCEPFSGRIERENTLTGTTTFSIHCKPKSMTGFFTMSGSGVGVFDLTGSGAVVAGDGAAIQQLDNGWFRCSITGIKTSDPLTVSATVGPYEVWVWGAQLEAGAPMSSFIYTDATAQTRAADEFSAARPRVIDINVSEDDAPVYDPLQAYVDGEEVMVLDSVHRIYKAIGGSTGSYPPEHPEDWEDKGPTNRWRMFGVSLGSDRQTVSEDTSNTINTLLDVDDPVNTVVLLNIDAASVRVIARNEFNEVVFDQTQYTLQEAGEPGWWEFFFGDRRRTRRLIFSEIPKTDPCTIQVLVDGVEEPARVGKLILTNAIYIGCTQYGTGLSINDYSVVQFSPFGDLELSKRGYSSKVDYAVQIDAHRVDEIFEMLAELRATFALFIGHDEFTSTIVYGNTNTWGMVLPGPYKSDVNLTAVGV